METLALEEEEREGRGMVTHARQTTDEGDRAEAVAAVLAASDPRGWTATEIVETLDSSLDVRDVQRDLEDLVARARLTRHGIGREALYSLPPRAGQADARAPGRETLRHGTQPPRALGRVDGTTDHPLALDYATVRTAYEAVRRGVVGASLEGAGACPRLAAELRALVALAAALHQHEHAAERGRGQPERRRSGRPWAARPRGDTAATPAARAHAPAATSA
jgi:hypothetical protein